jgi:hypothetical protein
VAQFNGVKVFSATKANERELLGEKITNWIKKNPKVEIVDKVITQSSDNEFHCLAITLFYSGELEWAGETTPHRGDSSVRQRSNNYGS